MNLRDNSTTSHVSSYTVLVIKVILLLFIVVAGKSWIISSEIYDSVLSQYAQLLGNSTSALLNWLGYESSYLSTHDRLTLDGYEKFGLQSSLAVRYYFYVAIILIPFTQQPFRAILLVAGASALLFLVSAVRYTGLALMSEQSAHFVVAFSTISRYFLLWMAVRYRIVNHQQLKKWLHNADQQFRQRFQLSLPVFVLVLITTSSWMSIIDRTLITPDSQFVHYFSSLILAITNWLVQLAHFQPTVSGYYIWIENVWVYLGSPCLGVGSMILFASLIGLIRSKLLNKLIYISSGLALLVVLNSARIAYILIHIYKNGKYTHNIEVHDLSNYFFYAIVFILLVIYIYWFQHLTFTFNKNDDYGTQHQTPSDN